MQIMLMAVEPVTDQSWQRAALRECIEYGEHGIDTETAFDGRIKCFNCGGRL